MKYRIEDVAASTETIVSSANAKSWLRVEHTADDTLIANLITAVGEEMERELGLKLLARTVNVFLERFVSPYTLIPVQPLNSVTGIYRQVTSETYEEWDSSLYTVRLGNDSQKPYFRPIAGQTYPNYFYGGYTSGVDLPVKVVGTVGWTQSTMPERIVTQALMKIAQYYENRQVTSDRRQTVVPYGALNLKSSNQNMSFD